jgi:hypothetical protein
MQHYSIRKEANSAKCDRDQLLAQGECEKAESLDILYSEYVDLLNQGYTYIVSSFSDGVSGLI